MLIFSLDRNYNVILQHFQQPTVILGWLGIIMIMRGCISIAVELSWKTTYLAMKIWPLKTGGLWWQVHLLWNVWVSAKNWWSFKTGGLSWQWSQDRFHCMPEWLLLWANHWCNTFQGGVRRGKVGVLLVTFWTVSGREAAIPPCCPVRGRRRFSRCRSWRTAAGDRGRSTRRPRPPPPVCWLPVTMVMAKWWETTVECHRIYTNTSQLYFKYQFLFLGDGSFNC